MVWFRMCSAVCMGGYSVLLCSFKMTCCSITYSKYAGVKIAKYSVRRKKGGEGMMKKKKNYGMSLQDEISLVIFVP